MSIMSNTTLGKGPRQQVRICSFLCLMLDLLFENLKLALFGLNVVIFVFVLWSTRSVRKKDDEEEEGDVLLVTAHPDDEVMFFAPLLVALRRQQRKVHILCLSSGSSVRAKELDRSCRELGVSTWECGRFVDGFDQEWDTEQVAAAIDKQARKIAKLKTVVSFDEHGVSGHPNHGACWKGCVRWAAAASSASSSSRPLLLFLHSVGLVRKYTGLVDALLSILFGASPFFLSLDPLLVWKLMSSSYPSQFVWYRKLYVLFSRYTFLNSFVVYKK